MRYNSDKKSVQIVKINLLLFYGTVYYTFYYYYYYYTILIYYQDRRALFQLQIVEKINYFDNKFECSMYTAMSNNEY